ncbi:hypothetical protein HATV-3_gp49 [Haloarcula tailed virus 3]|uniref:Uncharacterized protein n=1 Tax=Haloarcula tailed virus 3 TaxID=2877990 RepID=A0AAE8Y073_9CAUD|nr:hypothetical protein M1M35_gp49 [Haloarcula tailed virus 3]UBF23399.1 hypothetical protein HATV-3_gp49 [Haloarcula tailed virus 3]
MTHNPDVPAPLAHKERVEYASMRIDDEFVVFERQNPQAWVQSDTTVPIKQ